jgi:hypothetical protein
MISRTTIGRSFGGVVRYQFEAARTERQTKTRGAGGRREHKGSAVCMSADFNRGRLNESPEQKRVASLSLTDDAAKLDSAEECWPLRRLRCSRRQGDAIVNPTFRPTG